MERLLVNSLEEIITAHDHCVCVFIKQERFQKNLVLNENAISKCGIWKLDQIKMSTMKKVVVYYRHDGINEIIVGQYKGSSPTIFHEYYDINFQVTERNQTLKDWQDFTGEKTDLIKYYLPES